jgi:hypothetical protein
VRWAADDAKPARRPVAAVRVSLAAALAEEEAPPPTTPLPGAGSPTSTCSPERGGNTDEVLAAKVRAVVDHRAYVTAAAAAATSAVEGAAAAKAAAARATARKGSAASSPAVATEAELRQAVAAAARTDKFLRGAERLDGAVSGNLAEVLASQRSGRRR